MAEINKPSISVAWAETGSKVEPTDTKKNTGWVVEKPPYEWWNFIEHRQDKMLQHINQHGIAVWDAATEYIANKSYALGSNGDIYRAVADSCRSDFEDHSFPAFPATLLLLFSFFSLMQKRYSYYQYQRRIHRIY
jgi:hypothetical protein